MTRTLFVLVAAALALAAPAAARDVMRCEIVGNALDEPSEGEWGVTIDTAWFDDIKAAGFDTVRVPVRWSAHTGEGPDYLIDAAFRDRVDEVLQAALDADLQVIVNVHHFEELMDDPRGQYLKLLNIWNQLGAHYADWPDALHFELVNEPHTALSGAVMRQTLLSALEIVRRTNPTRTVILGGDGYSSIRSFSSLPPVDDPNVVVTFHYYDPFRFTHQRAGWAGPEVADVTRGWPEPGDRAQLEADGDIAAGVQETLGRPVFLGEFGAYEQGPYEDRLRYINAVRETFEAKDIGWCLWNFTGTFPLWSSETGFDARQLKALGLQE